ncbi:MAG: ATP synthase F1 subunit delta [Planctomycetota bacterium]|nr:MAG: ATP synthase F1 subunit delta [Planctomycetota bacterium]
MADTEARPDAATVDVGGQQVAAMYARALLGATEKAGKTEAVLDELGAIVKETLDVHPKFEAILGSGFIEHDEKVKILDRVFRGRVSPLLLNFLKVVSSHGRLDLVRAIYHAAVADLDELRGRVMVEVRSAAPLDDATAKHIATQMKQKTGSDPRLVVKQDPSLIGGVVLRVGDTVYDGSVATQLKRVRSAMINRSVHEIQSRRDRFRHPDGN